MKHNYTCFYKCDREKECPGGVRSSRCLRTFDPIAKGLMCAEPHEVPDHLLKNPPLWARASWDPLVIAAKENQVGEDTLQKERAERAARIAAASKPAM